MGFFRRIAGMFGISRDDADHHPHHHHHDGAAGDSAAAAEVPQDKVVAAAAAAAAAGNVQRRGFSVQVPVPVERPGPGPVLVPCPQGDGGVQVIGLCGCGGLACLRACVSTIWEGGLVIGRAPRWMLMLVLLAENGRPCCSGS